MPGGTEPREGSPGRESVRLDWETEIDKLSPEEQIRILSEINREAQRLLDMDEEERGVVLDQRKEKEAKTRGSIDLLDLSPEERKAEIERNKTRSDQVSDEIAKLRRETGTYFVSIRAEAERRRRAAESEELKELTTENSDELIDLFMDSLKEGNATRCAAILRKLTADTNENELLNYLGYPSNMVGLHRFTAEILMGRKLVEKPDGGFELGEKIEKIPGTDFKPLGLSSQMAFAIENDISYLAEEHRHWGLARGVEQRFGQFYQVSERGQAEAVVAELAKMNVQTMGRDFNRLAYGGEVPAQPFNPSAGRKFVISRSGLAVLINMAGVLEVYAGKGELNANTVRNLWGIKEVLLAAGVRPSFINALGEAIKKKVEPDLGPVIEKAMRADLTPRRAAA